MVLAASVGPEISEVLSREMVDAGFALEDCGLVPPAEHDILLGEIVNEFQSGMKHAE